MQKKQRLRLPLMRPMRSMFYGTALRKRWKNGGQLLTDLRYNKLEGERPGSLRPNGTP